MQRITRRQPIAEGGWSIFGSMWGGLDWDNPAGDLVLRGNGKEAWFGWPTAPKLEAIRDQWLHATDLPTQKALRGRHAAPGVRGCAVPCRWVCITSRSPIAAI